MSSRNQLLIRAINDLSREPFQYGVCDCCLFGWRVIQAYAKILPEFPYKYSSQEEADAIIAAHPRGLAGLVIDLLGPSVHPSETIDGDPVLLAHRGGVIGVRLQNGVVVKTNVGVATLMMRTAVIGWRVQ